MRFQKEKLITESVFRIGRQPKSSRGEGSLPGVRSTGELWPRPNGVAISHLHHEEKHRIHYKAATDTPCLPSLPMHESMGHLFPRHTVHPYRSVLRDTCEGQKLGTVGYCLSGWTDFLKIRFDNRKVKDQLCVAFTMNKSLPPLFWHNSVNSAPGFTPPPHQHAQ